MANGEFADEASLRALAHPMRWALIEVLGVEGTATAARCAEFLGQSQASCSFHLRQLGRFGVARKAPSTSRRDRPWRLTVRAAVWSAEPTDEPARDRAARTLNAVFVTARPSGSAAGRGRRGSAPQQWRRAAFVPAS